MMNEGYFIALRGIGQETNSLLMQLLGEQKRTNELLSQLVAPQGASETEPTIEVSAEREGAKATAKKGKGKGGEVEPDVNWNS